VSVTVDVVPHEKAVRTVPVMAAGAPSMIVVAVPDTTLSDGVTVLATPSALTVTHGAGAAVCRGERCGQALA